MRATTSLSFSLDKLFLLVFNVCLVLALLRACGIPILPFLILGTGLLWCWRTRNWTNAAVVPTIVLFGFTFVGILPFYSRSSDRSGAYCCAKLDMIQAFLEHYRLDHGEYPPAVVYDSAGQPMHSWRVLILKYSQEDRALYNQYRFDEPWDGPSNRLLWDRMPDIYTCEAAANTFSSAKRVRHTSYLGFTNGRDGSVEAVVDAGTTTEFWLRPSELSTNHVQSLAKIPDEPSHREGTPFFFDDQSVQFASREEVISEISKPRPARETDPW